MLCVFRCIQARGEEFAPCKQFWRAYHSLCPGEWVCVPGVGGRGIDGRLTDGIHSARIV